MWSDGGRAYLYKLPTNCIVESKDFHNKSKVTADTGKSLMFCQFDLHVAQKNLECPPVFKYLIFSKDGKWMKYLLRGDGDGRLAVWKVPDTPECAMMQLKRSEGGGNGEVASHPIQSICSLDEIWASLLPKHWYTDMKAKTGSAFDKPEFCPTCPRCFKQPFSWDCKRWGTNF